MMSVFAVFSVCNVYARAGPVQVGSGLCPQCGASVVYTRQPRAWAGHCVLWLSEEIHSESRASAGLQ